VAGTSHTSTGWAARIAGQLRVQPGTSVRLPDGFDPAERLGVRRQRDRTALLREGVSLLGDYQDRLAAQDTHAVLVVLQGMDGAGKDSTIKHVMSGLNPQGVHVFSFKTPSEEELNHDFLWRHAQRLPARGQMGIFNRSHYEEVLVVRVHPELLRREKIPGAGGRNESIWQRRYREINDWERYLTDNGTTLIKLFLNISREKQRIRFLRRIDVPAKNWKFSAADIREREYWDQYQRAYSEMLTHTSTTWAPWHVLPADHKWVTRICAAAVIGHALVELGPQYPVPGKSARKELLAARKELEAEPATAGSAPVAAGAVAR
jgi:PPK2 family polyphosphate:nucleotide phosphotransferase